MTSKTRRTLFTCVCLLAPVLTCGCSEVKRGVGDVLKTNPGSIRAAGYSTNNQPIEYYVHGTGDKTVMILGAIHGDEPASAVLVSKLNDYLLANPRSYLLAIRRIVVIPVANPDGLAANIRPNFNWVDLNRNFPTANRINCAEFGFNSLTEPESLALKRLIDRYMPMRIISVHQPLGCVDYDGPAQEVAEAVSEASGLPVQKLGPLPGSLGSYAGETRGVPIITLELPAGSEDLDGYVLWRRYKNTLLTAIEFPR
jgi:protein MpaA